MLGAENPSDTSSRGSEDPEKLELPPPTVRRNAKAIDTKYHKFSASRLNPVEGLSELSATGRRAALKTGFVLNLREIRGNTHPERTGEDYF